MSSTFYDLADARAALKEFLERIGHEPLLSESPTFAVTPGKHSHKACLDQVDLSNYLVLIIGGRRGGTFVESEKSITNEEYKRALKRKIPVFIFIKTEVETAWKLFKKNPGADFSTVVDDVRIFDFIDVVKSQSQDNWTHLFNTGTEIIESLRVQFAYIHFLFSQRFVHDQVAPAKVGDKTEGREIVPFPSDFALITDAMENTVASGAVEGLRRLHGILSAMRSSGAQGYEEKAKVLWLLGRYGSWSGLGRSRLTMPEASFKQYAWSTTRGERVFTQMTDFGVRGSYEADEDSRGKPRLSVELMFDQDRDGIVLEALQRIVKDLIKKYGDEDGLEFFLNGDMRLYGAGQSE